MAHTQQTAPTASSHARECSECGCSIRPADRYCPECGTDARRPVVSARSPGRHQRAASRVRPGVLATMQAHRQASAAVHLLAGSRVTATVIATEPVLREPARLRAPQLLHRLLIAAEVLLAPLVAGLWLLSSGRILPLLAMAVVIFAGLRLLRPTGLLGLVGLTQLFSSRRPARDTAVRHYRLRSADGQEVTASAVGEQRGGHLMPGDEVEAWGRYRWGVLALTEARNLRTGARTRFTSPGSWGRLGLHVLILGVALVVLISSGFGALGVK